MMELDSFAEIANRGAANRQHLKRPTPAPKPGHILPLGKAGLDSEWKGAKRMETPEELDEELQRQRSLHAPFLQRLAPSPTFQRPSRELTHWKWRMETAEDRLDFGAVLLGRGCWQDVTIPHYGGPVGRAVAYYRTEIEMPRSDDGTEWVLCFEAADYVARVYCNGRCLGQHEGFFAPFEFSLDAYLIPDGVNVIVVELQNDAICKGVKLEDGTTVEGDKLYAATGLGWDDPQLGWHHCPPGMGIFGAVHLEARTHSWVSHLWVRTLNLEGEVEVFLEISGRDFINPPVTVSYAIYGENFQETVAEPTLHPLSHPVKRGPNLYRFVTKIPMPRLWGLETPWLYSLQVTVREGDVVLDERNQTFGVRTFEFDTDCEPKGRFLLNGKELRLMGANTMGFEQQDVLRGDFDQLRDDLLLAKICHMNFLRLTQRPVQSAVYDLCDRLGVMTQSDLPHFAVLRRTQFAESVRQAGEMERMLCPHPCNIVVSYINEPFPADWDVSATRSLSRDELERFFVAADQIILSLNPDRVIKAVDGDYDPPAPGLPDNHTYSLWYVGHEIDAGALHAGHWVPVKPGWNYACGEFGAEGLDFADLMRRRYPSDWLPSQGEESGWNPGQIVDAQTGSHYCFFYDRQTNVEGWVQASQAHQSFAAQWMTEAFRRDRRMVSFAIHLFIDAWPAGWMKTIMDCERRPKPAYFAYRDALSPVHLAWRFDRFTCSSAETIPAELWVTNDSGAPLEGAEICYQILDGEEVLLGGRQPLATIPNPGVLGVGVVPFRAPAVSERTNFVLRAVVLAASGEALHESIASIEVFPVAEEITGSIRVLTGSSIDWLPDYLTADPVDLEDLLPEETVVCAGTDRLRDEWAELINSARRGARVVVLNPEPGEWEMDGIGTARVEVCGMGSRHFVSRATGHPLVDGFRPEDFRFWYDDESELITPLLHNLITGSGGRPILSSGQVGWGHPFTNADAIREYPIGRGAIILCCLELKGHLSNPVAREFLERLIPPCPEEPDATVPVWRETAEGLTR